MGEQPHIYGGTGHKKHTKILKADVNSSALCGHKYTQDKGATLHIAF